MDKFTPGPWRVVSGAVETMGGIPIASMDREPGNGTRPVERDENARLIAAAPDLFAALRGLLGPYALAMNMLGRDPGDFEASSEVIAARAALAAAAAE